MAPLHLPFHCPYVGETRGLGARNKRSEHARAHLDWRQQRVGPARLAYSRENKSHERKAKQADASSVCREILPFTSFLRRCFARSHAGGTEAAMIAYPPAYAEVVPWRLCRGSPARARGSSAAPVRPRRRARCSPFRACFRSLLGIDRLWESGQIVAGSAPALRKRSRLLTALFLFGSPPSPLSAAAGALPYIWNYYPPQ